MSYTPQTRVHEVGEFTEGDSETSRQWAGQDSDESHQQNQWQVLQSVEHQRAV